MVEIVLEHKRSSNNVPVSAYRRVSFLCAAPATVLMEARYLPDWYMTGPLIAEKNRQQNLQTMADKRVSFLAMHG